MGAVARAPPAGAHWSDRLLTLLTRPGPDPVSVRTTRQRTAWPNRRCGRHHCQRQRPHWQRVKVRVPAPARNGAPVSAPRFPCAAVIPLIAIHSRVAVEEAVA
jgi:hypothetical protein